VVKHIGCTVGELITETARHEFISYLVNRQREEVVREASQVGTFGEASGKNGNVWAVYLVEAEHSIVNVPVLHVGLSMRDACHTVFAPFSAALARIYYSWSNTFTAEGEDGRSRTSLTIDFASTTDPMIFEQAVIATISRVLRDQRQECVDVVAYCVWVVRTHCWGSMQIAQL
jgi:hypothetical protein